MKRITKILTVSLIVLAVGSCGESKDSQPSLEIDTLIVNGDVYTGTNQSAQQLSIAICGEQICDVFPSGSKSYQPKHIVDAKGLIVSPGFIDPHTHSLEELVSTDNNHNLNYLYQGVTTVVNGNDGGGTVELAKLKTDFAKNGIGSNVAMYVGHGAVRRAVMGQEKRFATEAELKQMEALVEQAMKDGALGLSSGLYYVPGNFANTEEVIRLAKVASRYNGIYDTHLRDESTFNIGLVAAVQEAIDIAKSANIHIHLGHLKALGVDVWGKSKDVIELVNSAKDQGVSISADQYPWLASGTSLKSALLPSWVRAGTNDEFLARLADQSIRAQLESETNENIRRRGGAERQLITAFKDDSFVGLTLAQAASKLNMTPFEAVITLVPQGRVRIASFNMSEADVTAIMQQPWVVTSSDGSNGHPRKYGSFPKKFSDFVLDKQLLTIAQFINRSSAQTASVLGLKDRGEISIGKVADVVIFNPVNFKANASYQKWNEYASGVKYVWVNGELSIAEGEYTKALAGKFVAPSH